MMFNTRIAYTRKQIGQVVGGSLTVPFPSKDGRVVAICLSRDANPDAPQRILVADRREPPGEDGRIDRREAGHAANMLVTQGGAVPLFIRETSNEWHYQGEFVVASVERDPVACAHAAEAAERDETIGMIISLALSNPVVTPIRLAPPNVVPSDEHAGKGSSHEQELAKRESELSQLSLKIVQITASAHASAQTYLQFCDTIVALIKEPVTEAQRGREYFMAVKRHVAGLETQHVKSLELKEELASAQASFAAQRSELDAMRAKIQSVNHASQHVFDSYSSKNQETADRILREIESAGHKCWQSTRDIPPGGGAYEHQIMEALRGSWLVVVVVTQQSQQSPHVKREISAATGMDRRFLPIITEGFTMPMSDTFSYHLQRFQYVQLSEKSGQVGAAVAEAWRSRAPSTF